MRSGPQFEPEAAAAAAGQQAAAEYNYCVFRTGQERYCLAVAEVEKVVEAPVITPVPLTPHFLLGIFNLHGAVVPVIDISAAQGRRGKTAQVVVGTWREQHGHEEMRLGIAADEVIGAFATAESPSPDDAPPDVPYCSGTLRQPGRTALLLDLRKVAEAFPAPALAAIGGQRPLGRGPGTNE
jgi:chemotaxis signal transduction protein